MDVLCNNHAPSWQCSKCHLCLPYRRIWFVCLPFNRTIKALFSTLVSWHHLYYYCQWTVDVSVLPKMCTVVMSSESSAAGIQDDLQVESRHRPLWHDDTGSRKVTLAAIDTWWQWQWNADLTRASWKIIDCKSTSTILIIAGDAYHSAFLKKFYIETSIWLTDLQLMPHLAMHHTHND